MLKLLQNDPKERLSAKLALEHEWFSLSLSEDNSNLVDAARMFVDRRRLKKDRPHEFKQLEQVTMGELTDEILRFGLDRNESKDTLKHHHSAIYADDILDQIRQNSEFSRDQK